MKLSFEFPSVSYREGQEAVARLARAIEQIGYDHIDMFDHVVMGFPIEGRAPGPYPAGMPILEALMTLSYIAAVTSRVTLGTEVLMLGRCAGRCLGEALPPRGHGHGAEAAAGPASADLDRWPLRGRLSTRGETGRWLARRRDARRRDHAPSRRLDPSPRRGGPP